MHRLFKIDPQQRQPQQKPTQQRQREQQFSFDVQKLGFDFHIFDHIKSQNQLFYFGSLFAVR